MTSGKPFSEKEIAFIKMHCKSMFSVQIAQQLGLRFPEDNGGSRDKDSVQRFMRNQKIIYR